MLGWTCLFALMSFGGAVASLVASQPSLVLNVASSVFAMLFFLSLLTRAIRGRTS
jgi:hypothetical protein